MEKLFLICVFFSLLGIGVVSRSEAAPREALADSELAQLGVTAEHLRDLEVVTEKVSKREGAQPGLTPTRVAFGNAGGNRFLWRIDFEDEVPENSNIIFYLNTDNNEETGRENYQGGIDLMVFSVNGLASAQAYTPEGRIVKGPEARTLIKGKHLYMAVDVDLHQEDGRSSLGMKVLIQANLPLKAHSAIPYLRFQGAPISSTPKVERKGAYVTSRGVVSTHGIADLTRYQEDKNNLWIPITEAELWGWRIQYRNYRTTSAVISKGQGSIKVVVPHEGKYHPAFILYEDQVNMAINISVNGERVGFAATKDGDYNQRLFAVEKAVDLKKGDILELRNLNNAGEFRIEGILFLKDLFPPKTNSYRYQYIDATQPWQNPEQVRITFTSTWPVQTKIHYGTTEKLGQVVEEQVTAPTNNHRIYLEGLKEGQKYFYRISGEDRNGEESLSPIQSFTFQRSSYPAATAETQTVPLTLSKTPAGSWPVHSGVPFPEGEVFESENIRLLSSNDESVAAQKRVLARWHDGSIRWALFSFHAEADKDQYRVEYGAKIKETSSHLLATKSDQGHIEVDTGSLQWKAERAQSGGYTIRLSQDGKALLDEGKINIRDQEGQLYSSDFAPDEIEIEENGAQRAVILLRGKLGKADKETFFSYEVRWSFTKGSSLTNVRITLINDQVDSTFSQVASADLQFKLPSAEGEITLPELGKSAAPIKVLQTFDDRYAAETKAGEKTGKRFPGWMNWRSGKEQFSLAVRNFWQLYPKSLEVEGDVLRVGIAPAVKREDYAEFAETVEEYRSVYYLMEGQYKLRAGVSFTTEIALDLGRSKGEALNEYLNRQPVLIASPEYYRDTKVFGDIGLGSEFPLVAEYNEKTASSFQNYLRRREKLHEFGLMNFGDWWGERRINWGNVEYDTMHAFILEFARSSNVDFLYAAQDAEIHNRDIDTVHVAPNPPGSFFSIAGGHYSSKQSMRGLVTMHTVGHTGDYFNENPVKGEKGPEFGASGILPAVYSSSHTWTEGHYEHYFLTGDTRSLDVGNSISDIYNGYGLMHYDFSNARVPGWFLILSMGAYDATDDPFYLNGARIVVDRVLERQTATGGWDRQLAPGHCQHTPPHHGNAGFMVGVLMTGLKNYAESTGDQRAKDAIVKAAYFLVKDMWIPEESAFRYTSCPGTKAAPGLNLLIGEGIAYAWRQTRDPELRQIMLDAMKVTISRMDGKGKNISMELRSTPPQLFDVIEMLKDQASKDTKVGAKGAAKGADK